MGRKFYRHLETRGYLDIDEVMRSRDFVNRVLRSKRIEINTFAKATNQLNIAVSELNIRKCTLLIIANC